MSIKALSTICLSIIASSLLSACGSGGGSSNESVTESNLPNVPTPTPTANCTTPDVAPVTREVAITNAFNSVSTVNLLEYTNDPDCGTITSLSQPTIGSVQNNGDGTVTYDPLGNVGSHFFTYTVSNPNGASSTSGVSIASVDPEDGNDNWPQVSGENITTAKNTSILIDVLANDFDLDGDELVLDVVDNPQHGTIEKQNGKVFYTPDLNYTGEDFFYYGVHDDHGHNGSGLAEITITE